MRIENLSSLNNGIVSIAYMSSWVQGWAPVVCSSAYEDSGADLVTLMAWWSRSASILAASGGGDRASSASSPEVLWTGSSGGPLRQRMRRMGRAAAAANNEILFRRLQRDSSPALAVAAVRDHNGKHGNLYNTYVSLYV